MEHTVGVEVQPQGPFITIRHLEREEARSPGGIIMVNHESQYVMAQVRGVGPGVDRTKVNVEPGDIILVNEDDGFETHGVRFIRDHMVYAKLVGVTMQSNNQKEQS